MDEKESKEIHDLDQIHEFDKIQEVDLKKTM